MAKRFYVIGNGFDLAHGLRTSYNDFIKWYWQKEALKVNKIIDEKIKESKRAEIEFYENDVFYVDMIFDNRDVPFKFRNGDELKMHARIKNKFMLRIEREMKTHYWSGIEDLYYRCLNEAKLKYENERLAGITPEIFTLNKDFREINKELNSFINGFYHNGSSIRRESKISDDDEQTQNDVSLIPDFQKIFDELKEDSIVINFNYTKLPELYVNENQIIYIHGNVLDNTNHIIFGYGDENARESTDIVESKENLFLEFSKSVLYFKSKEYRRMMELLSNSEPYEVCILGHSCANGDRTLLRPLFESKKCVRIKYFYYDGISGEEDYMEKAANIYRIFEDTLKIEARKRLLSFYESKAIPQFRKKANYVPMSGTKVSVGELSFVRVGQGSYTMGAQRIDINAANYDKNAQDDETPHSVTIDKDFYVSTHLITQKVYLKYMKKNPSFFQGINLPKDACVKNDNLPVEQVSWYDAVKFCNILSREFGREPYYEIYENLVLPNGSSKSENEIQVSPNESSNGFRLLTEEEWEFAARNGQSDDTDMPSLIKIAWYWKNSEHRTHLVGMKAPNKLGIYDMIGNVWEWCWNELKEPINSEHTNKRITRGASWGSATRYCRITNRNYSYPDVTNYYLGFRIAVNAD